GHLFAASLEQPEVFVEIEVPALADVVGVAFKQPLWVTQRDQASILAADIDVGRLVRDVIRKRALRGVGDRPRTRRMDAVAGDIGGADIDVARVPSVRGAAKAGAEMLAVNPQTPVGVANEQPDWG
ncbi:hypothetical protein D0817_25425, partial [Flavobacterium cupreum]